VCVAAAVVVFFAMAARAEAEPLHVVVRTVSDADRGLLDRIRGQTSDLDVAIEERTADALEPSLPLQLAAADGLAPTGASSAVVWFDRDPEAERAILVVLAVPRAGRVLVRRVEERDRSATLEAAALIVRSALQALAEGATIGVERATVAPPPPEPPPAPPPEPRRAPPPPPSRSSGWLASIGWQTALDGESRFGQQGLAGRFAWARAPLEIGVAASVGVPVEIADRYARLAVWRRTIAATGALRLGRAPLELVLGASAGAAAFGRSTVAHDENVEPQPPSVVWTPLVAPEATLRLLPRWLGGAVALSLALGADFVPGAPAFVYESQPSGTRETTKRLSWIEPRAGLAIELVVD